MSDSDGTARWVAHEPGEDVFAQRFAEYLDCDPDDVFAEFGGTFRMYFRWADKEAHANIKERRTYLISRPMDEATQREMEELEVVEDLLSDISNIRRNRNAQAHLTALCVARLFKRLKRKVTFGISGSNTQEPSTPYGHAVRKSFLLLGLKANWRRPADAARKKI